MKKLILLAVIVLSAYSDYLKEPLYNLDFNVIAYNQPKYKCDGRKYCSQMTSCEEAKFFLKNCPDPKMDGDKDGIPCEKQWCGYH